MVERNRGVPMLPPRADDPVRVRATDDEKLARELGLTEWDEDRGQYVAPSDVTGTAAAPDAADVGEVETYTGQEWTKERLQEEAARRKLDTSGNKPDLIARLVENDANTPPV